MAETERRRRRHRGEDSTYRTCHAKHGCPPVDPETGHRPEHGKHCKAPWAYSINEGIVAGKRVRRTVTAQTKPELMAKVKALKEKQAHGVSPTAQTVGGWLDYWVTTIAPANGVRARSLQGYRSYIRLYLKPALGHIKLQDLTADHIDALIDWMRTLDKSRNPGNGSGPLSESTIRQAVMVLRSALKDALRRRKVLYNAAAVVAAPSAAVNPHEHLDLEQAKRVLRVAAEDEDARQLCRLLVALALGIRQGEALGLRWAEDYRIAADGTVTLDIEEAIERIDGELTRTDVKSAASHRPVPVPEAMVPFFEAWRALSTDPYMFPGITGGPCDAKHDWTLWRESLARAGVSHVPLHGARGSAASLLADMGVPDWMIAEILGHGSVKVTRKHYIRGTTESQRKALSGLLGELLP